VDLMRMYPNPLSPDKIYREIDERKFTKPVKNDTIIRACLILYHDDDTTDDRLILDDEEIYVHKYILLANAANNKLSLNGEKLDTRMVSDVKAFHYLIKFMYILEFMEGEEPISIEDANSIWQCGMLFLDDKDKHLFEKELCKWFFSGLSHKTVFKVLQSTEEKGYALCLRDSALTYVVQHFSDLGLSTQLQTLPKNLLLSLLQKLGGIQGGPAVIVPQNLQKQNSVHQMSAVLPAGVSFSTPSPPPSSPSTTSSSPSLSSADHSDHSTDESKQTKTADHGPVNIDNN